METTKLLRRAIGRRALLIIVAALASGPGLIGLLAVAAEAPCWPRFHGPNGDNHSPATGLLKKWSDEGAKLIWTAKGIGHGFAGVTIADGRIYTAGEFNDDTRITALGMDGHVQWQSENGKGRATASPAGARCTPTIDGDRLYHENAGGQLVCLEAKTGNRVWGLSLGPEFQGKGGGYDQSESPLIDGDRVICCPGGVTAMVALDKNTGKTVWRSPSVGEPAGYTSPMLVCYQGLRMILAVSQFQLIGVNADTGELLWQFKHYKSGPYCICAMPVYHDGRVFLTAGYGMGSVLLQIKVEGKKATVEPVWRSTDLDNRQGGVILLDGYLYGVADRNSNAKWICLEWKTGKTMYAERGLGQGSLTYADGMLYVLSERGKVGMVRATPMNHDVTSTFEIPKGGDGPVWAHPVVCGDRLYVRHGDFLYVYSLRAT
ncbi:MAG: PQQ-binding-like beta-propeller repeat protein [Planctomycetota bacterium]|nr:PQQ-binding-like beta-propeller repeat protein [Planctomycetota bacterium]